MIELTPESIREGESGAWKDYLLIAALYFGGMMMISWCAVLLGLVWWLITLRW